MTSRLSSDDGSRLFIDDIAVIDHWGRHPFSTVDDAGLLSEDRLVPSGRQPDTPV